MRSSTLPQSPLAHVPSINNRRLSLMGLAYDLVYLAYLTFCSETNCEHRLQIHGMWSETPPEFPIPTLRKDPSPISMGGFVMRGSEMIYLNSLAVLYCWKGRLIATPVITFCNSAFPEALGLIDVLNHANLTAGQKGNVTEQ